MKLTIIAALLIASTSAVAGWDDVPPGGNIIRGEPLPPLHYPYNLWLAPKMMEPWTYRVPTGGNTYVDMEGEWPWRVLDMMWRGQRFPY